MNLENNFLIKGTSNPEMYFLYISDVINDDNEMMLSLITNKLGINDTNSRFFYGNTSVSSDIIVDDIVKCNPSVIMAIGLSSFKLLFPESNDDISSQRSKVFKFRNYDVVPTYSPNYILENINLKLKQYLKQDIEFGSQIVISKLTGTNISNNNVEENEDKNEESNNFSVKLPKTELILNYNDFDNFCKNYIDNNDVIGYDVETNALPIMSMNHKIVGFSLASSYDIGCYVPLESLDYNFEIEERRKIEERLKAILGDTNKQILVYNSKHEIPVTWNWLEITMIENVFDLFVLVKLLNAGKTLPKGFKGLKYQSMKNLGVRDWSEDLDSYFKALSELGKEDNQIIMKSILSKYYFEDELEEIYKSVEELYNSKIRKKTKEELAELEDNDEEEKDEADPTEEGSIFPYSYVPFKLIGTYGSYDASMMFGLKECYLKKVEEENKVFDNKIDLMKGYTVWMKHHIAGSILEMNGAYWNDRIAQRNLEWCESTQKQCMKDLISSKLSYDYIVDSLKPKFSLALMVNECVEDILDGNFSIQRRNKDSIGLTISTSAGENLINSIIDNINKENSKIREYNRVLKETNKRARPSEFMKEKPNIVIKVDKKGNKTVKLGTAEFLMLADFKYLKENPEMFEIWSRKEIDRFVKKDPSLDEMKEFFNITSSRKELRDLISNILITNDIRLANLYCNIAEELVNNSIDMNLISDSDKLMLNEIERISSMTDNFYDPVKFKEFKELYLKSDIHCLESNWKLKRIKNNSYYNYQLTALDSAALNTLFNLYGMLGIDPDNREVWTDRYEWMFNYKLFKKLNKVKTTYIWGGSTGRGNVYCIDYNKMQNGDFCRRIKQYSALSNEEKEGTFEEYTIELENGKTVNCSPFRKFMLVNGLFKEARFLTEQDEIDETKIEEFND